MPDIHAALTSLLAGQHEYQNQSSDAFQVLDTQSVGGGCISDAKRVLIQTAAGKQTLFVKCNDASFIDNFQCESVGLGELTSANAIRVPRPIAVGVFDRRSWLIIEWLNRAPKPANFFQTFGLRLAELHRATLGSSIGADSDNYLGAAVQPNPPSDNWADFFAQHRIGYQIRWAADQGFCDSTLRCDCETITNRMGDLLDGRPDETCLLHGDLWSGNYLCDDNGEPVVIDPAAYRGCREAEFGMLRLFGSCPQEFYEAYQSQWPMSDRWEQRADVYILYHLLNHLNLFGRGYHDQCRKLAMQILRR